MSRSARLVCLVLVIALAGFSLQAQGTIRAEGFHVGPPQFIPSPYCCHRSSDCPHINGYTGFCSTATCPTGQPDCGYIRG